MSTFGCILPSCVLVSLLSYIYRRYRNLSALQNVLACLRPAVVALIAAAGCTILQLVAFNGADMQLEHINVIGVILFAGALAVLRLKKWNPILVMVLCGVIYTAIHLIL